MPEPVVAVAGFVLRGLSVVEAQAQGDRLREIFRDAVNAAGPTHYPARQVAAWAGAADNAERWAPRLADGRTWIAATREAPGYPVGFAMRHPVDDLDLLFVDPAFHRRGLGAALLAAVADEAREAGVAVLTADASLMAWPVFVRAGYDLVAWEEVEFGGLPFRRARMRKVLS